MDEQVQWHEKGIEPHPNFFVYVCLCVHLLLNCQILGMTCLAA